MKVILKVPLSYVLVVISLSVIYGCKKDEKRNDELIKRFEGKYKIVRATSSQSVDLDLNGTTSSDMFFEIPNLKNSYLDLRLNTQTGAFIYSQLWPNQFISEHDAVGHSPNIYADFASQATAANFTVDEEGSKLVVFRDWEDPSFPLPNAVNILPNDRLKVLMDKTIYTSGTWSTISVEVEYERFTTEL